MISKAKTVADYLAELPPERRKAIDAIRNVILKNLDKDYEEGMQYGMIAYYVPHRVFPAGYHCNPQQPLQFAALAAQKNNYSLYLMCLYACGNSESPLQKWFAKAWKKSGKKLDMGKSCIRFKSPEDVPLDVIAELIARVPAKKFIEVYESMRKKQAQPPKAKPAKRS